ncbi:MAG: hypothetical protein M3R13_07845 [Armatimonadota bacterium]|nr:hypothetical protein [Armatimonadota bacterium]
MSEPSGDIAAKAVKVKKDYIDAQSAAFFTRMDQPGAKFDADSMRYVVHFLHEPGLDGPKNALLLVRGIHVSPQYRDIAAAIIEDKCIRAPSDDKAIWLFTLADVFDLPSSASEDTAKAFRQLDRIRAKNKLDEEAEEFAENRLNNLDFSPKLSALIILVKACEFGGEDAEWALDMIDRQSDGSNGSERRFWIGVKGSVTGELVYPSRPPGG